MGWRKEQQVAEPVAPWTGVRWEYRFFDVSKRNEKTLAELNQLGADGWELVAIGSPAKGDAGRFMDSSLAAVLKRPVVG